MSNLYLYTKAHFCNSSTAAVKLAEKNPSDKNINFAKKLLSVKNAAADISLTKLSTSGDRGQLRTDKYHSLLNMLTSIECGKRYEVINLAPANAPPVQYYKGFSIEEEIFSPIQEVIDRHVTGFLSDFRGTGEPALLMHGSKSGNTDVLAFFSGLPEGKNILNVLQHSELVNFIKDKNINLDMYSPDTPLNLIACYSGGKNGTAQKLANALGRPVKTYVGSDEIVSVNFKNLLGNDKAIICSRTRLSPIKEAKEAKEVKDAKIYYPETSAQTNNANIVVRNGVVK